MAQCNPNIWSFSGNELPYNISFNKILNDGGQTIPYSSPSCYESYRILIEDAWGPHVWFEIDSEDLSIEMTLYNLTYVQNPKSDSCNIVVLEYRKEYMTPLQWNQFKQHLTNGYFLSLQPTDKYKWARDIDGASWIIEGINFLDPYDLEILGKSRDYYSVSREGKPTGEIGKAIFLIFEIMDFELQGFMY